MSLFESLLKMDIQGLVQISTSDAKKNKPGKQKTTENMKICYFDSLECLLFIARWKQTLTGWGLGILVEIKLNSKL